MIEKIITSKIRVKLLKLFLSHIDDRYYLRELERKLEESLSPLRRQLLKLEKMGILKTEYEANLKYYRLNKEFDGMEELRGLVLGQPVVERVVEAKPQPVPTPVVEVSPPPTNRIKYDMAVLSVISFFILAVAVFVLYTGAKSARQVANFVSEKPIAEATRPDEMVSRRWKLFPGNVPVLSSGETGGGQRSEEL
ncbi:winged helix-turn-helix domain-containing protein [Candidatus Omnitrophota bacterium]